MSDVESSDLSDWDREEMSLATKMFIRRWTNESIENTQGIGAEIVSELVPEFEVDLGRLLMLKEKILCTSPRRWCRLKPKYKLAIQQILRLAKKIESGTSRRCNKRFTEHDWFSLQIPELAEETQSSSTTEEGEGALRKTSIQCHVCHGISTSTIPLQTKHTDGYQS